MKTEQLPEETYIKSDEVIELYKSNKNHLKYIEDKCFQVDNILLDSCATSDEEFDSADDSAGSLVDFVVDDNYVNYCKNRNSLQSIVIEKTKREKIAQELRELQTEAINFIESGTYT